MARRAPENGILHDDALAADRYRSSLGNYLRPEHDATARANADVAADHGIRCDPGARVDARCGVVVLDQHLVHLDRVFWFRSGVEDEACVRSPPLPSLRIGNGMKAQPACPDPLSLPSRNLGRAASHPSEVPVRFLDI